MKQMFESLAQLALTHSQALLAARKENNQTFTRYHEKRIIDLAETIEGCASMDAACNQFEQDVAVQNFANDI